MANQTGGIKNGESVRCRRDDHYRCSETAVHDSWPTKGLISKNPGEYHWAVMLREREFFGDQELILIYMAKRLKEARAVEDALNAAELDYAVVPEHYTGGVFFTSQRVGAFFYVSPPSVTRARAFLLAQGFIPREESARGAALDQEE
ncbi:MAG: hypothetical protein ABSH28_15235 [Acidobacteriota bacterium]